MNRFLLAAFAAATLAALPARGALPPDITQEQIDTGYLCSADLDSDGEITADEMSFCTPDGFCDLQGQSCAAQTNEPVCPEGTTFNAATDLCESPPTELVCPSAFTYDPNIDRCVAPVQCLSPGNYDGATDLCEQLIASRCPLGFTYSNIRRECWKPVACEGPFYNGAYNETTDTCEMPHQHDCPSGFSYNDLTSVCEAEPYCPVGSAYDPVNDRCEALNVWVNCTAPYNYDPGTDLCVQPATCPAPGVLNPLTNRCEYSPPPVCLPATVWNGTHRQCETSATCPVPTPNMFYFLNGGSDLCQTYVLDHRCPINEAGFPFTYANAQCELSAVNVCRAGALNSTTHQCEVPAAAACPPATTYDAARRVCTVSPTCDAGFAFHPSLDRCYRSVGCPSGTWWWSNLQRCATSIGCPGGGFWNASFQNCTASYRSSCAPPLQMYGPDAFYPFSTCRAYPACPSGTSYDTSRDECRVAPTFSCPGGYSYSANDRACIANAPPCAPAGLDIDTGRCLLPLTGACEAPYTWNAGLSLCTAPASCPPGTTYSASPQRCEGGVLPSEHPGYAFSGGYDAYFASLQCPSPNHWYDATRNRCCISPVSGCPPTYSLLPDRSCVRAPECASGGVYNTPYDRCMGPSTGVACPPSYFYSVTYDLCIGNPSCSGGVFNAATHLCEAPASAGCSDPSYTLNATSLRCERAPACAFGTYNVTYDLCMLPDPNPDPCPGTMILDAPSGQCVSPPDCTNGTLDSTKDLCYQAPLPACPQDYLPATATLCTMQPVCGRGGAFDGSHDLCTASGTYLCAERYYFDSSLQTCASSADCGASTGYLEPSADQCKSPQISLCPANHTLSNGRCETLPSCPAPGVLDAPRDVCLSSQQPCSQETRYDPWRDSCFGSDTCPLNGMVVPGPYCAFSTSCPAGFTTAGNLCVKDVTCPAGGTYNANYVRCETPVLFVCPAGSVWDAAQSACRAPAVCAVGALDVVNDRCVDTVPDCPGSYTYPGAGSFCFGSGTCPAATVPNPPSGRCDGPTGADLCGAGQTYDPNYAQCWTPPTCPPGLSYSPATNVCESALTAGCPPTFQFDVGTSLCRGAPSCTAQGVFDTTRDVCIAPVTVVCPPEYPTWDPWSDRCGTAPQCSAGTLYQPGYNLCASAPTLACSGGYVPNMTSLQCVSSPTCPPPSVYDPTNDLCAITLDTLCGQLGFQVDPATRECYAAADCLSARLDPARNLCTTDATVDCGGWQWDPALDFCVKRPVCNPGAYDATAGECRAAILMACAEGYEWDEQVEACVAAPTCARDPARPDLDATIHFSPILDVCLSTTGLACGANLTWSGPPLNVCEIAPTCPGTYVYDPVLDVCTGPGECPWGVEYPCLPDPDEVATMLRCARGTYNGATGKCEGFLLEATGSVTKAGMYDFTTSTTSVATGSKAQITTAYYEPPDRIYGDGTFLQAFHDGTQIVLQGHMWEAGRWDAQPTASRDGLVWIVDGQVVGSTTLVPNTETETVAIAGAASAPGRLEVRGAGPDLEFWDGPEKVGAIHFRLASYSEPPAMLPALACSPNTCVDMKLASDETNANLTGLGDDGWQGDGEDKRCLGTFYIFNGKGGECLKAGVSTSFSNCCSTDPQDWAGILPSRCPQESLDTYNAVVAGRTHEIGTYCKKRMPFTGTCIQKAKVFCNFGSVFSRIVQEQGRPQLEAFQPNGQWGIPEDPNCIGFLPEQFQALDFGKIDLGEYIDEMTAGLGAAGEAVGEKAAEAIERKMEQLQ